MSCWIHFMSCHVEFISCHVMSCHLRSSSSSSSTSASESMTSSSDSNMGEANLRTAEVQQILAATCWHDMTCFPLGLIQGETSTRKCSWQMCKNDTFTAGGRTLSEKQVRQHDVNIFIFLFFWQANVKTCIHSLTGVQEFVNATKRHVFTFMSDCLGLKGFNIRFKVHFWHLRHRSGWRPLVPEGSVEQQDPGDIGMWPCRSTVKVYLEEYPCSRVAWLQIKCYILCLKYSMFQIFVM